jgi:hypothetical protein
MKILGKRLKLTTTTVAIALWRVAEAHAQYYYDNKVPWYSTSETVCSCCPVAAGWV